MGQTLDTEKFVSLKTEELGGESCEAIVKLQLCTQSIHRWIQYCEYHYSNIKCAVKEPNLKLDRALNFRRAGETVSLRYVYEANITAFLHCLHSMIDSFPYLLNLFIPMVKDFESTSIKWQTSFINKYKGLHFFDELVALQINSNFNKVKGYVNTGKHKHIVRISNQFDHLEFEEFSYKKPRFVTQGDIQFESETITGQHVIPFIEECHDELIPTLFDLCESVFDYKQHLLKDLK